jgi:AraC-like DNA-binding protein
LQDLPPEAFPLLNDFTSVFETTPHQWLLNKKIEYAEQLLKDKKMKASDIYMMLGFNELSLSFFICFPKKRGFIHTATVLAFQTLDFFCKWFTNH